MSKLSNEQFEALKARLNSAIHEIVFACHHAENDQIDDALSCVVTAQGTLDAVAEELAAVEKAGAR